MISPKMTKIFLFLTHDQLSVGEGDKGEYGFRRFIYNRLLCNIRREIPLILDTRLDLINARTKMRRLKIRYPHQGRH